MHPVTHALLNNKKKRDYLYNFTNTFPDASKKHLDVILNFITYVVVLLLLLFFLLIHTLERLKRERKL